MCMFPIPNTDFDGLAYKKGVKYFDCGACPECLHKRASVWALRCVYESKAHVSNCMVTLTYDNFVRNDKGEIIGETPVNPNLKVNQRDVQLFFKRLRKWYSKVSNEKIKYLCSAEYGSRTHRAHYHCILFGVRFPDLSFYKKSKRGNPIYMSKTLLKLWNHGICTVDSINVQSAVARYCTKYCCKQRSDRTFMLTSQRIGLDKLCEKFNGRSYFIDGVEHPVPRVVWEEYICNKYAGSPLLFSPKYVNKTWDSMCSGVYDRFCALRRAYRYIRDNDPLYISYLDYWKSKGEQFNSVLPDVRARIQLLDDRKYHYYKVAALKCYSNMKDFGLFQPAPGSNCGFARQMRLCEERFRDLGIKVNADKLFTCRVRSRLITASDTINRKLFDYFRVNSLLYEKSML